MFADKNQAVRPLFTLVRVLCSKAARLVVPATLMLSLAGSAWAEQKPVSMAGKTIMVVIPFAKGGGTDIWVQQWMPLLAERLPGKPDLEYRYVNYHGTIDTVNKAASAASDDGMIVLASSASVVYPHLLGSRKVKYDLNNWQAVIASGTGGVVVGKPGEHPFGPDRSPALKYRKYKLELSRPDSLGLLLLLSMDLLGIDFETSIRGAGGSDLVQDFYWGRTEIALVTSPNYFSTIAHHAAKGRVELLFSLGVVDDNGVVIRDPTFPDLPTFLELCQQWNSCNLESGLEYRAWLDLFYSGFPFQKALLLPVQTRPEIQAAFRAAAAQIVTDGKVASSQIAGENAGYTVLVNDEANELKTKAIGITENARYWLIKWLRKHFGDDVA